MCNPAAVAATGVVLGGIQGQQQANAENRYEQALYGERKADALDAIAQLDARGAQERQAAAQDIQRVTAQARKAAGAARLQAVEAGVRGKSIAFLLDTFEADRLAAVDAIETNLGLTEQQIAAQRRAAARVTPPRRHRGPFDSPLGIASLVFGGVAAGMAASPTPAPAPT